MTQTNIDNNYNNELIYNLWEGNQYDALINDILNLSKDNEPTSNFDFDSELVKYEKNYLESCSMHINVCRRKIPTGKIQTIINGDDTTSFEQISNAKVQTLIDLRIQNVARLLQHNQKLSLFIVLHTLGITKNKELINALKNRIFN